MIKHRFLKASECDVLLVQYKSFCRLAKLQYKEEFLKYQNVNTRLDVFFCEILNGKSQYSEL